jgi:hypothetical protein
MLNDEFEKKLTFNKQPTKRVKLNWVRSWDKDYSIGRQS